MKNRIILRKGIKSIVFKIVAGLVICLVGTVTSLSASEDGLPNLRNYSKAEYGGGNQNWVISQDERGVLYFGNNYGTLIYDGNAWNIVTVPNYSVVRALFPLDEKRVLVGAFEEFGTISMDSTGNYTYSSWYTSLPENLQEIGDIWKIYAHEGYVFLQSNTYLLKFDKRGNYIGHISSQNEFLFSFLLHNRLIIQETQKGLFEVRNDSLIPLKIGAPFIEEVAWEIVELDEEQWLIFSQSKGAWIWDGTKLTSWESEANDYILENSFYSVSQYKQNIYIGTVQQGLINCTRQGEIVNRITKNKGLQNNTVLAQFIDRDHNLWLGLDNGIDLLEISSPVRYLGRNGLYGTGYASVVHQQKLFLGTNQGVFVESENESESFTLIEELKGQVWSLHSSGRELLCAHHNGIFQLYDDKVSQLFEGPGCWMFLQVPWDTSLYLAGTYFGIGILQDTGSGFSYLKRLEGFDESSRVMCFDSEGDLWISHGYKGIFRLKLNRKHLTIDTVEFYGPDRGLPTETNNEVFTDGSNIFAATVAGIYKYDSQEDLFVVSTRWNNFLGSMDRVSKLIHSNSQTWWIFQEGRLGKLEILNDSVFLFDRHIAHYLNNKFVPAFEHLTPLKNEAILVGTEDGFARVDLNKRSDYTAPNIFFTSINCFSAQRHQDHLHPLAFNTYQDKIEIREKIPYSLNNLNLQYAVPRFGDKYSTEIHFTLNDESWQGESGQTALELSNLREGSYKLEIEVTDYDSGKSEVQELIFAIQPPWYRHTVFFIALSLFFIMSAFFSYRIISRRVARRQRLELVQQKRKMMQREIQLKQKSVVAEQELVKMRNEKLQAEVVHKSKELANSTMNIIHKNQILTDLKNDLLSMSTAGTLPRSEARKFIRKIDRELEDDQGWKVFETHFDRVHENFFQRIREKHQSLTPKDLRMCAFLRMNLSSKEIAPLQNISIRSVEISRYRLRKKLGLSHDQNLTDYIMSV